MNSNMIKLIILTLAAAALCAPSGPKAPEKWEKEEMPDIMAERHADLFMEKGLFFVKLT